MKYLVIALVLVLVSCSSSEPKLQESRDLEGTYVPQETTILDFAKGVEFGQKGMDLSQCRVGTMENGVIKTPSEVGPVLCLILIEQPSVQGEVVNLGSTITVNNGLPAVILRSLELPSSYWERILLHESVHARRIPALSSQCRQSWDCRLDEEVIAYSFQFQKLEEYWKDLGWTGGDAPVYPKGDDVVLQALNFERVLWQYHQNGMLKIYLSELGYSR